MMKIRLNFKLIVCALLSIALSGCTNESVIERILADNLPKNTVIIRQETCTPLLGPIVATFSAGLLSPEKHILEQDDNGVWQRFPSLQSFSESDKYKGAGIGATILDGKVCLRQMSDKADEMLFEKKSGIFFRSHNREIVIAIFDEPRGQGVLFVQAP